jgi:hypothetical protein
MLTPDNVDPPRPQQGPVRRRRSCPHRPLLASSGVVLRPAPAPGGSAEKSSTLGKAAVADAAKVVPSESSTFQSSRVEIIRKSLVEKGFSDVTASFIARPHKVSSSSLYDAKWNRFNGWCRERKIDPVKASVPVVADFLVHLFESNRCVSTIKGYRTAIAHVLHQKGVDLSHDRDISQLISSLEIQRPPSTRDVPKWDLSLVLSALTKTAFLLALASAKRISEVHAFSKIVNHKENYSSLTFTFVHEFIAKTQRLGVPETKLQPVTIPALTNIIPDEPDRLLCPVRAVRRYLDRMSKLRSEKSRRLFISYQPGRHDDITKNAIALWLKAVIKDAYDRSTSDDHTLHQVKPHEIRAFATSLAFASNLKVQDVMDAASWRGESTFARFYLRDLAHQYLDVKSLGPIVAGQTIVSSL